MPSDLIYLFTNYVLNVQNQDRQIHVTINAFGAAALKIKRSLQSTICTELITGSIIFNNIDIAEISFI
jgi:hypothetical protein